MKKPQTIHTLINKAVIRFNKYIRDRDKDKPCISCGRYTTLQAGHFYSAGHHPGLRFDEDNVHGQCLRCNMYLSGNLHEYAKSLPGRIGQERYDALCYRADAYKKTRFKWNRWYLEEIIEKYK